MGQGDAEPGHGVQICNEKVSVFEHDEHTETEDERKCHTELSLAGASVLVDHQTEEVVAGDADDQEYQPPRAAPRVEDEREQQKDSVSVVVVFPDEVNGYECQQEYKHKQEVCKFHNYLQIFLSNVYIIHYNGIICNCFEKFF